MPSQTVAMGRRARSLWRVAAVAAIVAGTIWLLDVEYRSPRSHDLESFVALAICVGTVAAGWAGWAGRARIRQGDAALGAAELDHLTDMLAGAVKDQWTRAAADRGTCGAGTDADVAEAIPASCRAGLGGHRFEAVSASVGAARSQAATIVGRQDTRPPRRVRGTWVRAAGDRRCSRGGQERAAILLVLATLKHRDQIADDDRPRMPVPMMFTLNEWDPNTQRVQDWIAARLQQTYPLLTGKSRAKAATLLSVIAGGGMREDGPGRLDVFLRHTSRLRPISTRSRHAPSAGHLDRSWSVDSDRGLDYAR